MRALITGGAGFIGSHLAERLLGLGWEVVILDNLSTGSLGNIAGFRANAGLEFVEADVRDTRVVGGLVERSDVVFHLAAAVGVQLIADRPVHTIETNIHGTEVVLDCANRFKKKVLIASTSEVYGKSESIPFNEDDDIILGSTALSRWSYACSKAIDEFLGLAFHQQYGLEVIVARFFNTIGPRQSGRYGMVVPRFVASALKGEAIEIYGTGDQTRCFSYVGDVVDAVISLVSCDEACGRVFNVGSTEEISIVGLADKIIAMTGSSSTKVFLSYEKAYGKKIEDMMRRQPDIRRIKKVTGWEPVTSLERTLETIIASLK